MKIYRILLIIGFLVSSCGQTTKTEPNKKENLKQLDSVSSSENSPKTITQFDKSDLEKKVFEVGSKKHFTDSCSFYFECDCCSGELMFNADSTFFYLDYCMSDKMARKGIYKIENSMLNLKYESKCVSRKYNYENEIDTSAVDFFMTDTLVNEISITYLVSICNGKLLLTDEENEYNALETNSSFSDNMEYLRKEDFLVRFDN